MPGSFTDKGRYLSRNLTGNATNPDLEHGLALGHQKADDYLSDHEDSYDDGAIFDDDIFATGEMKKVPF
jgi:hypothetical protein